MTGPGAALEEVADRFLTAVGPGLQGEPLLEFAVTALDRVGSPVWCNWWYGDRLGGRGFGGIGYGPTEEAARVGALGELVEHSSSRRSLGATPRESGSPRTMRARYGADAVVDPRLLGLPAGSAFDDDQPLQWWTTRRLRDGADVWAPAELVASEGVDLTGGPPPDGWLTVPVSNGLGAGSTYDQAVAHGLLEVLQRDGNGLSFRALDAGHVLDLDGVDDAATLTALRRLADAGIEVVAKVAATDFGLANLTVVGMAPDDDVLSATACGEAVHPDREVALRKAVLEFANARARKQLMHGPVERVLALAPEQYAGVLATVDPTQEEPRVLRAMVEWLRAPREAWEPALRATVLHEETRVAFTDLPTRTPDDVLADVTARLAADGFDVLVRDLSTPRAVDAGVVAVKVLVPGLEVETVAYTRIGERNLARLLSAGRDDLVRVGRRPEGWSRVHLTNEARDRVGGDAWLDRAALDALPGPLFPLYREPGRHAAPLALGH